MFLDQASLEVSAGLKDSLQGKLGDAEWLVLLLSEESAGSRWVSEEIAHWLADKPKERIALVQTAGEIAWDDDADDFDMARSTAVPENLRGVYSGQGSEPLWLDLRWAADPGDEGLDLRNTRFRDAIATLAAPIHGKPKDELEGEDIRQHRRLVRLRRAAVAGLTLLTIAATVAGVLALFNAARARAEARTANARLLASQSRESFRPDQAVLVALEAMRIEPNVEARGALLDAVRRGAHARAYLHDGPKPAQTSDVHPALGLVATGGREGLVAIWDVSGPGRPPPAVTRTAEKGTEGLVAVGQVLFHTVEPVLYTAGSDLDLKAWDVSDPREPALLAAVANPLAPAETNLSVEFTAGAAVSPDGRLLVMGSELDNAFGLWDVSEATRPRFVDTYELSGPGTPSAFAFSDDGELLAVGTGSGFELWDVGDGGPATPVGAVDAGEGRSRTTALDFAPGVPAVAWGGAGGGMRVWGVMDPAAPDELVPESGDRLSTLSFTDADLVLVGTTDGQVVTFAVDQAGGAVPTAFLAGHGGEVLTARLLAGGETLVSVEREGTVVVWDATGLDGPGVLGRRLDGAPADVAFDPAGAVFWTVADRGLLRSWDLGSGGPAPAADEGGDGPAGSYTVAAAAGLAAVAADVPFALGGAGGTLVLWDSELGDARWGDPLGGAPGTAVALSDDGAFLAAGTALPGATLLWDLTAPAPEPVRLPLADPESAITALAFHTAEGWLAEGGGGLAGGSLRLWDVSDPAGPAVVFGDADLAGIVLDVAFSPDGTQLVAGGSDGALVWWDLFRDTAQREGGPVAAHTGEVQAVDFSPDGATVVSAGDDGRTLVWDADSRTRIAEFADFTQPVTGLAFEPQGGNLISAAQGFAPGFVAWELDPDEWRRMGCAFTNRDMTDDEWARYAGVDEPYVAHCGTGG